LNERNALPRAAAVRRPDRVESASHRRPSATAWQRLLASLQGRRDWRGHAGRRTWLAAKYLVRSLLMPRQHAGYLALIAGDPLLHAYRRRDPRVLERHFHRFINLGWNRRQRLQAISRHYGFMREAMPDALLRAVYGEGKALLGQLTLKDGRKLILSLRPPIVMGCEGELCIQLGDEQGHAFYRLVVSVVDDAPTLVIGCLQGPAGEESRELVRGLTRNMHGLRPKCLMLSLARVLVRQWGIVRLLAVANAAHPLRNPHRRFVADYDTFWQEQQGRAIDGGWFELPLQVERKSEAEVPSQHRSAFRKREALRMAAERILEDALQASPEPRRLCA